MSYFSNVATLDEGKERYRALAREHHPDVGGATATMQAINAEWEMVRERLERLAASAALGLRQTPHYPRELVLEQSDRMIAAMLERARQLVPGVRVYKRGNTYYQHICIVVPADHEARAALLSAGYKRHSAWKCWRKELEYFDEYQAFIAWLRGKRDSVPFADVVELEVAL